jgi:hypothetical protein
VAAEGDLAGIVGCGDSFTLSTKVLLADGKTVSISKLKPGDKVLATNTKTGKTQAEAVARVEVNHDHDLYDLRVKSGGRVSVIHTTSNHLFWDPSLHQWIAAAKLKKGEHLKTANGVIAVADGGTTPKVHDGWMWDLTIPGNNDHDFYVMPDGKTSSAHNMIASDVSVLVHNASVPGMCDILRGLGTLAKDNPRRTVGILDVGTDQLPFVSGSNESDNAAYQAASGTNPRYATHVEAKAASFLHANPSIRQANLYVDYPGGACSACSDTLESMLPTGVELFVYGPDGVPYGPGGTMAPYIGN